MKKTSIYILSGLLALFATACATKTECNKQACQTQAKNITATVDCSALKGKIKALNGVNFGPKISTEDAGSVFRKQFYDLNVQSVRLHDISLQNPGLMIVDTDMVFPLFHADAKDPKNYIFKPTDDYIKISTKEGAKIIYRLGVSIDHSIEKYRTAMPDPKKWAEICCQIIAHYNEGWANGYKMNIEHWEIWNEPECKNASGLHTMWAGNLKQFTDFYIATSKIIKARYPHLKIGGPAFVSAHENMHKFIKDVAAAKAPLDFISWHRYGRTVDDMVNDVRKVRGWLDASGFKKAETHFNEWHYFPIRWSDIRSAGKDKDKYYAIIKNIESGAFSTATMTAWQDEALDIANYYTFGGSGNWGMIDNNGFPCKSYYPFKAFGQMVKNYPDRLATTTSEKNAYALAGKNNKGKMGILVSLWKTGENNLTIDFKNCKADLSKAKVLICDDNKNLEPACGVKIEGNKINLPINSKSSVVYIEL